MIEQRKIRGGEEEGILTNLSSEKRRE